jgi:hypothetical protein
VSGPEFLSGGAERDRAAESPGPRRFTAARRRWTGIAGTVLVAAAALVLAARSLPEPVATPPPTAPTPHFAEPTRFVADVAVGTEWAYVLLGSCVGPEETRQCRYRVLRRGVAGGRWTATAMQTGPVAGATGPARLFATSDDRVTVLDQPTVGNVHASPDGGDTATVHALSEGPPVAAVPPGGIIELGLCESCLSRLTVLEPATGRLRPLARPPRLGTNVGIRSIAGSGSALWVLGDGGSRLISAVSLDAGRTWRVLPVGGAGAPAEVAALASDGRRGAYLLVDRAVLPDVRNEWSELWRVGDPARPGAAWRSQPPIVRPRFAVGLTVTQRGLLVQAEGGALWRLGPEGQPRELPPIEVDGVPVHPGRLAAGGRMLLGVLQRSDTAPQVVLVSSDDGETWRVERIPL